MVYPQAQGPQHFTMVYLELAREEGWGWGVAVWCSELLQDG